MVSKYRFLSNIITLSTDLSTTFRIKWENTVDKWVYNHPELGITFKMSFKNMTDMSYIDDKNVRYKIVDSQKDKF